ncbi:tyrosine-type recombinase/integrase [Granulicella aggregans]|uniref:tyrosine-type recombinase/integrase n=1 Tax=Granulicella aggregans TaxID=474949 RepID=UPI0021E08D2F|nr:site-specific integrase [Granulicella aggregans]
MTNTRSNRYQEGTIERVKRAKGPDVWVYRWRELQADGTRVQRKKTIGDVRRLKTKDDVKRAVENLRAEINAQQEHLGKVTMRELIGHFQAEELSILKDGEPEDGETKRSPTTIQCYLDNFKLHILPKWGDKYVDEIETIDVEKWLRSLKSTREGDKRNLAPATKAKLRNQMSCVYSHGLRHKLAHTDPIKGLVKGAGVRQGSARVHIPDILTLAEMQAILAGLTEPMHRTLILVAAVTGIRRSEIRGLRWSDVDFDRLWLSLKRGIVRQLETRLKTEGSRKGVPVTQDLADALLEWRRLTPYPTDEDWVFASPAKEGKSPVWLDVVMQNYIKPAAKKAGVMKCIGWHTFRRSLASILADKGENVKVVQELLRHANSSITMDLYQQAGADAKRQAQAHVGSLFVVPKAS